MLDFRLRASFGWRCLSVSAQFSFCHFTDFPLASCQNSWCYLGSKVSLINLMNFNCWSQLMISVAKCLQLTCYFQIVRTYFSFLFLSFWHLQISGPSFADLPLRYDCQDACRIYGPATRWNYVSKHSSWRLVRLWGRNFYHTVRSTLPACVTWKGVALSRRAT